MKESLRQKEAFEYYYGLGDKRSCSRVAEQFQVSERTIFNWSSQFKWQERLRERDICNGKKLEEGTNESIVQAKSKYIHLIRDTLQKYEAALHSGNIKINSVNDLERLAKLEIQLREIGEEQDNKVEVIIRTATAKDVKNQNQFEK